MAQCCRCAGVVHNRAHQEDLSESRPNAQWARPTRKVLLSRSLVDERSRSEREQGCHKDQIDPCPCIVAIRRARRHAASLSHMIQTVGSIPDSRTVHSDGYISVRDRRRKPPLRLRVTPKLHIHWCWIKCTRCPQKSAVAIAPYVIRWGPYGWQEMSRQTAQCTKCGKKGRGAPAS